MKNKVSGKNEVVSVRAKSRTEQPHFFCFSTPLEVTKCLLLLLPLFIVSCSPPVKEEPEFSYNGIPRLAKYYDEITESGDTIFKVVPDAVFINQYGNSFSTAELKGTITVMQVFFASCQGICPVITGSMANVQKEFAGNSNVNLISLSVDPERDTVAALMDYAKRFKADSTQWMLLTGDKKNLYDYIRYGLQLPDIEPGDGGAEDFIHSDQLVLVDRNSIIRGYYGGTDTAQVRMLIEDIHILINEK